MHRKTGTTGTTHITTEIAATDMEARPDKKEHAIEPKYYLTLEEDVGKYLSRQSTVEDISTRLVKQTLVQFSWPLKNPAQIQGKK